MLSYTDPYKNFLDKLKFHRQIYPLGPLPRETPFQSSWPPNIKPDGMQFSPYGNVGAPTNACQL